MTANSEFRGAIARSLEPIRLVSWQWLTSISDLNG